MRCATHQPRIQGPDQTPSSTPSLMHPFVRQLLNLPNTLLDAGDKCEEDIALAFVGVVVAGRKTLNK